MKTTEYSNMYAITGTGNTFQRGQEDYIVR